MRIWSLHPRQLDRLGLVAAWREALLAQAVLSGRTSGYRHHPQLLRFKAAPDPAATIGSYLIQVAAEGEARGYRFDRSRVGTSDDSINLTVTEGQLLFEWSHLLGKLRNRDTERWYGQRDLPPEPHPLFRLVTGPIEPWERS